MAKSQSDTLRTGDFIEAVYPRHSKNRRTDQGTYLSLDMAPLFAPTLDPFMAAFRFYRPPSSFTTFALLSREQTVEIDKIRALLACFVSWRGGNAALIKRCRFWGFTRRDETKTRRGFVLWIRSRTAFLALTMTSVTWRLCTRKRRWLLRFGSNYDRGAENSLVVYRPPCRQLFLWANSDRLRSLSRR